MEEYILLVDKHSISPKVFPNKCIAVVISGERSGDGANGYNYVWNVTRVGFEASYDKSPGFWMAIGY